MSENQNAVKVSIVIPVYNVEPYIRQCLDSVVNQTLQDIEIIVVDDGSPDNCPAIIDEYAKKDSRIVAIHQKNSGVSTARNVGIEHVRGKYVFFCDSDDWLELNALEELWKAAERTDSDLVYGDYYKRSESKSTYHHAFTNEFTTDSPETVEALQRAAWYLYGANISTPEFKSILNGGGALWRVLIRSSVILDNNLRLDPYVRGVGDDILFTVLVYEYVRKISYISVAIYNYRIVSRSLTHGYKPNFKETYSRVFERIDKFISDYKKNEAFRRASYIRVLAYLNTTMNLYFINPANEKNEKQRFAEFKDLVGSEPYHTAVLKAPLKTIKGKKKRLMFWLLRIKCYKVFWALKKRSIMKMQSV